MKNIKKIVAAVALFGVIGASAVYAADLKSPSELAAQLTGKSISEVQAERTQGKTYGAIASEAGKLDEFKVQMLEQKKAVLDQRVKEGILTQEQADSMYNTMKNNQAVCDGTGAMQAGRMSGAGYGKGSGMGMGYGAGRGAGMGNGSCAAAGQNQ